jgi:putative ABC transport system ATP-binding protein
MQIQLTQLVPIPLEESLNENSSVWNQDVSFSDSERVIIDAQSGKGKSTFIQTLYGIRQDYRGDISFNGKGIRDHSKNELAELRQHKLSIVFQDLRLFHDLTARDNILVKTVHGTAPHNLSVEDVAERLHIRPLLDRKAGLLSYGERQRVATIRSLMQPFEWILLDEPFSHLDEENTLASYALIKEIADLNNAGIIITTLGKDPFIEFERTLKL